ncbi:hypothetical protein H4Q26_006504 [Puccinia striiformis f. sp. tritici PST-130]|nr:hypothetical protein H4Q26_006504 [Puccinia striiformis f. sp. tritici PST-130]
MELGSLYVDYGTPCPTSSSAARRSSSTKIHYGIRCQLDGEGKKCEQAVAEQLDLLYPPLPPEPPLEDLSPSPLPPPPLIPDPSSTALLGQSHILTPSNQPPIGSRSSHSSVPAPDTTATQHLILESEISDRQSNSVALASSLHPNTNPAQPPPPPRVLINPQDQIAMSSVIITSPSHLPNITFALNGLPPPPPPPPPHPPPSTAPAHLPTMPSAMRFRDNYPTPSHLNQSTYHPTINQLLDPEPSYLSSSTTNSKLPMVLKTSHYIKQGMLRLIKPDKIAAGFVAAAQTAAITAAKKRVSIYLLGRKLRNESRRKRSSSQALGSDDSDSESEEDEDAREERQKEEAREELIQSRTFHRSGVPDHKPTPFKQPSTYRPTPPGLSLLWPHNHIGIDNPSRSKF